MTQHRQSGNTMPMVAIAAVLAIAVGGIIMINANKKSSPEPLAQAQPEIVQSSPEVEAVSDSTVEVKTFEIEAGSFYYKPAEIRVKKGEKVKIVIKSVDMMHDFNIDELGVKTGIAKAGESAEVEFTADQAGSFEYYCSVGQHRQRGQVGTLIVEE